jgi:acetyl esterase/lipase
MAKIKLHPELRFRGNILRVFALPVSKRAIKVMYKLTTTMRGRHSGNLRYEQIYITRSDGTQLRVCVYTPMNPALSAPGLVWIHGGGFSVGTPEQDEKVYIKRFIDWGAGVVVAPDYTKSVEKPYPAALEDCYAALLWLRDNGTRYDMRPDQLFIGGDSAGGGLTAALSLYARDKGDVKVAFQMPLYPMIDDRPTASNTDNKAPVWNSKVNELGWRLYLGDLYGKPDVPCYAAPSRATDYSNLPPTFTFVGDIEPFYDEVVIYAENLRKHGVHVDFKVFEGCFHAFDMICPKTNVAKEAAALLKTVFQYAVNNYFAEQL